MINESRTLKDFEIPEKNKDYIDSVAVEFHDRLLENLKDNAVKRVKNYHKIIGGKIRILESGDVEFSGMLKSSDGKTDNGLFFEGAICELVQLFNLTNEDLK